MCGEKWCIDSVGNIGKIECERPERANRKVKRHQDLVFIQKNSRGALLRVSRGQTGAFLPSVTSTFEECVETPGDPSSRFISRFLRFPSSATGPAASIRGEPLSLAVDCGISRPETPCSRHPLTFIGVGARLSSFPSRSIPQAIAPVRFSLTVRALKRRCKLNVYVTDGEDAVLTFASGFLRG